ncbi:MAG: hypothetical protein HY754_09275 [Nitrospirae bacterium]|nr:hypothetical protein [Nitrospirota bacterium]
METKPKAIESFDRERVSVYESSAFFEHPIERLKYHIGLTGGKILKSEFSPDGIAYVLWESEGKKYNAWCSWPSNSVHIHWKEEK